MIPPKIEELVWRGDAEIKTWTMGSPMATLECPSQHTIIIFQMLYFPFIDSGTDDYTDAQAYNDRANKQITISTTATRTSYLMRSYWQQITGVSGVGIGADSINQDMYFVATGNNITAAIADILQPSGWFTGIAPAPPNSEIHPPPLTYGQLSQPGAVPVPTLIRFNFGGVPAEVRPFFKTRPSQGNIASFNQFETPFDLSTQLNFPSPDATLDIGAIQFPLVTFTYALINKNLKSLVE